MKMAHSIYKSFKFIAYSEGKNKIELDIDRGDHDAYLYVPNLQLWDSRFEWARGRRDEIIRIILDELNQRKDYKYIAQEY